MAVERFRPSLGAALDRAARAVARRFCPRGPVGVTFERRGRHREADAATTPTRSRERGSPPGDVGPFALRMHGTRK
jgi:hypothetical protein